MKNIILWLLLLLITACSKDEPEPDLTKDFIGVWKSEIEDKIDWATQSIWTIDKISKDEVRIVIKDKFISKNQYYDSYDYDEAINSVRISKDGIMVLDFETVDDGETIVIKGTGIIKGNVLSIAGTGQSQKEGAYSFVLDLRKH